MLSTLITITLAAGAPAASTPPVFTPIKSLAKPAVSAKLVSKYSRLHKQASKKVGRDVVGTGLTQ